MLKKYDQPVRDLVGFLQYILNTVGDRNTSTRDKEVIINESYRKIFRDEEVQVEDDLLADRLVSINKDVQAYLKDVDFFFGHIQFDFQIVKVEPIVMANGQWSFKVETNRTLKGTSLEGEEVLNTQKRFIEINLDSEQDELSVASIYTTKVSREKALAEWWNSLSFEWMSVLSREAGVEIIGEPAPAQLAAMAEIDSLNLRDNRLLADIQPLEMLLDLRYLDIANTRISDLGPLRSLSELTYLDVSGTSVDNLEYLKYAGRIRLLNLSNTAVAELAPLLQLESLQELYLRSVPAADFEPVSGLTALRRLDLSFTAFSDPQLLGSLVNLVHLDISFTATRGIEALGGLWNLQVLQANQTFISDLSPLTGLQSLRVLEINETPVSSLQPLLPLPALETVYCDNTSVTDRQADEFMASKKGVLVIINSRQLEDWWNALPGEWRMALQPQMNTQKGKNPSKEQLVSLTKTDSLVLVNKGIRTLDALERFKNLKYLDISKNPLTGIIALSGLTNLKTVKANDTPIEDVTAFRTLKDLERLELVNTRVYSLDELTSLPKLNYLNLDDTFVTQGAVMSLLNSNPACTVIFQTKTLNAWWDALSEEWKDIFAKNFELGSAPPGTEALHRLIASRSVDASNSLPGSLTPLYQFIRLEELRISGAGITDLSELKKLNQLRVLDCSKNPVSDITPLRELLFLEELNVSSTAVDDLRQVENLTGLEKLYCAGTQLKNLRGIERFGNLKEIDFSNTKVRRLDRLVEIRSLQSVVCFNTKVSSREISDFRKERPQCSVTYY